MDYQKIYNNLVSKTYTDDYTEVHHIIPKCLGGDDSKDNLVRLSPEAHYLAHQLLVKIYPDNHKLVFAAKAMAMNTHGKRPNNKLFGWLKRKFSKAMSESMSVKIGEKNHRFGTKHSIETKEKMSASSKGENNSMFGKTGELSPFFKKPLLEETKRKISESLKGKPGPNKGKKMSNVAKQKISEINTQIPYYMTCIIKKKSYKYNNACQVFPELKIYFSKPHPRN